MTVQVSGPAHPEAIFFVVVIEQLLWYQSREAFHSILTIYLAFTVRRKAWKHERCTPQNL